MISILFLAADPTDASRLRLGEEAREIQEKLQLSKWRDKFALHQRMSVRPMDISQALLDINPQIVHFSGHGTSSGALCFENKVGEIHTIQPKALATLFEQFANHLDCVVLNACYSAAQAKAIAKHIRYVIGMNHAIGDRAAISFSVGFYQAIGAGRSIEEAFKLGCTQIQLANISEHLIPVLLKNENPTNSLGISHYTQELYNEAEECPICGKQNSIKESFRCLMCKRPSICLEHMNQKYYLCFQCANEIDELVNRFYRSLYHFNKSVLKEVAGKELIPKLKPADWKLRPVATKSSDIDTDYKKVNVLSVVVKSAEEIIVNIEVVFHTHIIRTKYDGEIVEREYDKGTKDSLVITSSSGKWKVHKWEWE